MGNERKYWEFVQAYNRETGDITNESLKCSYPPKSRLIPDIDEAVVLRKVIENLAFDPKWEVRDEIEFMEDQINHWINQARRQLESEGER